MNEIKGQSPKASDSEIVKHACQLFGRLLEQLNNGVNAMLVHVDIVGRPSLQIVYVLFFGQVQDKISLFSIHLFEDCLKGILGFVRVMVMEFVHVEGKIRQHLIVELIEDFIFQRILALNFSEHITESHKHTALIEHVPYLLKGGFAWEEVQSLPNCYQIEFLFLTQIHYMVLREHNRMRGVTLHEFLNVCGRNRQHLLTEIDSFDFFEVFAKAKQNFTCADRNVQVPFFVRKLVDCMAAEFLRIVRAIFLIVEALSLEIPDVHGFIQLDYIMTIGISYELISAHKLPTLNFNRQQQRKTQRIVIVLYRRNMQESNAKSSMFNIRENVCTRKITNQWQQKLGNKGLRQPINSKHDYSIKYSS